MARFGIRCEYDGIKFASEPERDFYIKLVLLKKKGLIKDFVVQPNYPIQESFETNYSGNWTNIKVQPITITPDYLVTLNNGEDILLDTKGSNCIEEASQLRRKLFLYQNRTIPLFFIGVISKYLGGQNVWVEVTQGSDFIKKLKGKYENIYPQAKGNRSKPVNWQVEKDWDKYFEYENVADMFYIWKSTKKIKKDKVDKAVKEKKVV